MDHWLAICPPNVEVAGGLVQLGRWQLHQGVAGDQGADNIPFSKLQGDLAHLLGRLVPACLQDPFAEKTGSCSTWFDGCASQDQSKFNIALVSGRETLKPCTQCALDKALRHGAALRVDANWPHLRKQFL